MADNRKEAEKIEFTRKMAHEKEDRKWPMKN